MKRFFLTFLLILTIPLLSCERQIKKDLNIGIKNKKDLTEIFERYHNVYYQNDIAIREVNNKEDADYSRTNTQVTGIDEDDIVKTDGTYIYMPLNNEIIISKVYPADDMKLVKKLSYDNFYPYSVYVDDNYLVVIGTYYNETDKQSYTKVIVYDKTNYNKPKDIIVIEGYIVTSRKIDDVLLLVSNKTVFFNPKDEDSLKLPELKVNNDRYKIDYPDIHYQSGTIPESFVTIHKFTLSDLKDHKSYTYLGSANQVYVSYNNIYIAQYQYEFHSLQEKINDKNETGIMKISYADHNFGESKNVYVKGYVNNQFSMDEYQNTFRVVTTSGRLWENNNIENNLYLFDENLKLISKIEGIAKGERLQSARFFDNRIYLVTFKQVDPFFVIEVSNPKKPKILGVLKIPGYSTYLHPYDDNHIIGFGFETKTVGDSTVTAGIKLTMFNVIEPQNPKALFNEVITFNESSYVFSEVCYNHRALLFDKDKNIIAFPFVFNNSILKDGYYQHFYRQSYKVYHVNLDSGFKFMTDISHFDGEKGNPNGLEILRGLYIDNILYTVSHKKIQAHDLMTYNKLAELYIDGK